MEVEGGSHLVLSEGDLDDEAKSTTPTRTLPRMWTIAEAKWFAKRWSYDDNASDKNEPWSARQRNLVVSA